MKKIYLTMLIGITNSFYCLAQPTLTAANSNPVIGDNYVMAFNTNGAYTNPTQGANQTWNFSTLPTTATIGVSVSSAAGSIIPSASFKVEYTGGSTNLFNASSTELAQVGVAANSVDMIYSNPEKMLQYPFQFGNSFSDDWKATFISGMPFIRTGTTGVSAVGYGSLILPSGTFTDVLLVSFQQNYTDSTSGTEFGTYSNDSYLFYKSGYHQPILSLSTLSATTAGGNLMSQSFFHLNTGPSSLKVENISNSLTIYPNPFKDNITVSFVDNPHFNNLRFNLIDITGKLMPIKVSQSNNAYRIEPSNLPSGTYRLAVFSDNKKIADKAVQFLCD
jgi:hypothetical protein